ncbi:hypothetical protein Tco_0933581 [Tanacetum coccineum]
MAESSSQNPSSPEITPKEEPVTLDKSESPNPFLPASQVDFTFDEITFTTNNEVALLYPSHPNQEYFKDVSDFISKCCRVRGDIGYSEEIGAKGTLKKSFLLLDYAKLIWEDLIHKLNKKTREKIVPYLRFISLLLEHMMPKYDNEELIINPTQVFSVHNWTLKPNQPEKPPFTTHMKAICNLDVPMDSKAPKPSSQTEEAQQAAGGPTSLRATSEEGAHPQLSSGKGASSVARQIKEETSSIIKLEDLAKLVSHVQPSFKDLDSPEDDYVIVVDDTDEDEIYATTNDETEDTLVPKSLSPKSSQIQELTNQVLILQSQKHKLELEKNKAEAEAALLKAQPSFPNLNTNRAEGSSLKFNELTEEVKGLTKQVHELEIELPGDLKEIPTKLEDFTKTVASVQAKLKTLDALLGLLLNVTQALNKFAHVLNSASSKAGDQSPELSKLLASHNFASCLPTDPKELPSKFTELSREIKELQKHVKDMEIELPGDLKEIPTKLETFTSTISSLTSQVAELKNIQWELPAEFQAIPALVSSVQKNLQTLDSLPSLLNKVTQTLDRFTTVVENASSTTKDVPLAGQATTSPTEGRRIPKMLTQT